MLGTGQDNKTDEFSENFQSGGGGHFQAKKLCRRCWTFILGLSWVFFENEGGRVKGRLECFRKFIGFGTLTRPRIECPSAEIFHIH